MYRKIRRWVLSKWYGVSFEIGGRYILISCDNIEMFEKMHNLITLEGFERITDPFCSFTKIKCWYKKNETIN